MCRSSFGPENAEIIKPTAPHYESVPNKTHQNQSSASINFPINENIQSARNTNLLSAKWGRYGCDAPHELVRHALNNVIEEVIASGVKNCSGTQKCAMPAIIVTGDFAAHVWGLNSKEARWKNIEYFTDDLRNTARNLKHKYLKRIKNISSIEDVQIIFAIGNNDIEDDYYLEENSEWASKLYKYWKDDIIPASEKETFQKGIYYETKLKSAPRLTILSLNTIWYSIIFSWKKERPNDPGTVYFNYFPKLAGQFEWLKKQLDRSAKQKQQVLIIGHIPPGVAIYSAKNFNPDRQWHPDYEKRFLQILNEYKSIILIQLFGHFHTDDFRLEIGDFEEIEQKLSVVSSLLVAPSIGTDHNNNPGWRLLDLEINDKKKVSNVKNFWKPKYKEDKQPYAHIVNYHQFVALFNPPKSLDFGPYDELNPPPFIETYSFKELYGESDVSTKSIENVLMKITSNATVFRTFWYNHNSRGDIPAAFILKCVQLVATDEDIDNCYKTLEHNMEQVLNY